jgi:CHC2 zinc finger
MTAAQTPTHTKPKAKFIDFQTLKQEIRIEEAMPLLGLTPSQFSDQMRSPCPACKSGGDRALVITASKSVFYCFASGQGGDVIALTAHIKGIGMKEAAAFLAEHFQTDEAPKPRPPVATVPSNSSPKKEKAGLNPLTYLQPKHPAVQALGIDAETAENFGAGYAPKGTMRGRVLFPIRDRMGVLLAYCGLGENPRWLMPQTFDPATVIFASDLVTDVELRIVSDPLEVLTARQNGLQTVCFLTETVNSLQVEMLASLLDEKNCELVF